MKDLSLNQEDQLVIVTGIDAADKALAACYGALPPAAQAQVLEVGHSLALLRAKLRPSSSKPVYDSRKRNPKKR
jgi:hypothetical protein